MSTLLEYLGECEKVIETWPEWKRRSFRDAIGLATREDGPYESVTVTSADTHGNVELSVILKTVPYIVPLRSEWYPSTGDLEKFKDEFRLTSTYIYLSVTKGASDHEIFFYDRADGFFIPAVNNAFLVWESLKK